MDESSYLSAAVHELKNPLLAIERLSDILLEKESLPDDVRRKLQLIHSSAEEASDYLNRLITSSALHLAEDFSFERVDVGRLGQAVVDRFQVHAEDKDQTLCYASPDTPCVVVGSASKLREAMNNLVSNALKYSPHGGAIDVQVTRSEETVRFSVSDSGPGLSEGDQQRLFRPFQRLTPEPTGDENSTGMGLYITKEIVDRHHGTIDVDSDEGAGSTFALLLPVESSSRAPADVEPSRPVVPEPLS
jgi:signal transduction histidine kinase